MLSPVKHKVIHMYEKDMVRVRRVSWREYCPIKYQAVTDSDRATQTGANHRAVSIFITTLKVSDMKIKHFNISQHPVM